MNPIHFFESGLRLLWISDLHIKESYAGLEEFIGFKDDFIKFYETQPVFDYILFSGDIGFSATENEYKVFWNNFIVPLHDYHESSGKPFPKIICIPGNHDISWKNTGVYEEFLKSFKDKNNTTRNELLKNKDTQVKFFEGFKYYSERFGEKGSSQKEWKKFFDFSGDEYRVSASYQEHKLFGYLVDKKKKVVFIFLNSAWFSIGGKFNNLLQEKYMKNILKRKNLKSTEVNKLLSDILEEKSNIVEYGNQLIGRDLFRDTCTDIGAILALSADHTVITCMHHPLNWLNWNELYHYDKPTSDKLILNRILSNSDILLTGHEHVPVDTPLSETKNGVVQLKSGMFLDETLIRPEGYKTLEHSCLSILSQTIKKSTHTVDMDRFLYFNNRKNYEWKKISTDSVLCTIKKNIVRQSDLTNINDWLKKQPPSNLSFINKVLQSGTLVRNDIRNGFRFIITETDKAVWLILVPFDETAYSSLFPAPMPADYVLDDLITECIELSAAPVSSGINTLKKEVKIQFSWAEHLAIPDEKKQIFDVVETTNEVDERSSIIAGLSDLRFNLFRHHFFGRYKDEANLPKMKQVRNLAFLNQVLPIQYLKNKLV
ncbi:MAG: metallophosphoesterase [Bacteroidota bacterium]